MHSQSSASNVHQRWAAATQESRHRRTALAAPAQLTLCFCPWILFASRAASLRKQPSSVEQGAGLQDCSTSEDVLPKGEIKLLDLLPHCRYWKLSPQNLSLRVCLRVSYNSASPQPVLAGGCSTPVGTGGQSMGSFGGVYCVPTQQDPSDNKTGHKVCVEGEATASFKRIFIRKPWRHHPLPFAILIAAEQQPACCFWSVLLTLCLGNSWQYVGDGSKNCKTPLKNVLHLRNTKPRGQGRHIYTENWFHSCCKSFRECLSYCGRDRHALVLLFLCPSNQISLSWFSCCFLLKHSQMNSFSVDILQTRLDWVAGDNKIIFYYLKIIIFRQEAEASDTNQL